MWTPIGLLKEEKKKKDFKRTISYESGAASSPMFLGQWFLTFLTF